MEKFCKAMAILGFSHHSKKLSTPQPQKLAMWARMLLPQYLYL